jgi:hypothetical protein
MKSIGAIGFGQFHQQTDDLFPQDRKIALHDILQNVRVNQVVGVGENVSGSDDSSPCNLRVGQPILIAELPGHFANDLKIATHRIKDHWLFRSITSRAFRIGQGFVNTFLDVNEIEPLVLHRKLERLGFGQLQDQPENRYHYQVRPRFAQPNQRHAHSLHRGYEPDRVSPIAFRIDESQVSMVSVHIVRQAARRCAMSTNAWNQNDNTIVPTIRTKMIRLLALAILAFQPLRAQIVTATDCVHQAGDNPDWARPDFDDRQWSTEFPKIGSPFIWTRCRLDLSSLPSPISVGVEGGIFTRGRSAPPAAVWELFVDGQAAGSFGDLKTGSSSFSFQQRPLPVGHGRQRATVVALRQLPGRFIIPSLRPSIAAGHPDSLRVWHSEGLSAALWRTWPSWAGGAFTVVIGMVLLLLFFFSGDRSQRSLLWFGLYSVCYGFLRFQEYYLVQTASGFPNWLYVTLWGALTAIAFGTFPNTFFCMTGRRVPTFYSFLAAAAVLFIMFRAFAALFAPIQLAQQAAGWGGFGIPLLLLLVTAPAAAFWPFSQVPPSLRLARNLSLLFMLGLIVRLLPQVRGLEGFSVQGDVANFQSIVALFVLLGLFVVIARQNRQVALDRAELQGEMKSAQEVQQLLTSSVAGITPWADVQVAYLPAKEVGGDFYFVRETVEGQLVVVGDVSGKGLRAAMLASVALGSLRSIDTSSPAHLLEGLNKALHGQTGGGFVTCAAALFGDSGQVTITSAGHPAPYLDGNEVQVESGLPLGVIANATYVESKNQGSHLLLVSDGVVEAENASRQLFGFDRTREISMKPAQEIADAAKAWGQNDDITVVTVRRNV